MSDFMEMLKPTLDAINETATASYAEGYKAAQRDCRLQIQRALKKADDNIDAKLTALTKSIAAFLERKP